MIRASLAMLGTVFMASTACAHPPEGDEGTATYLANEAIMITVGETKLLFDPIYDNLYGQFQPIPEDMRAAMIAGDAPFDGIDAVFVTHAHGDHFAAGEMADYLAAHRDVAFYAPTQAVDMMRALEDFDETILDQVTEITLSEGDDLAVLSEGDLTVEAVMIPHLGGEQMADIDNAIYRVTVDGYTVMHLGDANADDAHFEPYDAHWQARETGIVFPHFAYFIIPGGTEILYQRLNAREAVGFHVPVNIPPPLQGTEEDYFHEPGETRSIPHTDNHEH